MAARPRRPKTLMAALMFVMGKLWEKTLVYTDRRSTDWSAALTGDGSFRRKQYNRKIYQEISCYEDGKYKNVGTADGVIYYHIGSFNNDFFQEKGIETIQLH